MASNDTTASGDVLFQDGDDLSETNIAETAAKSNQSDYVERGLGFSNISSGSVTVGSGHAVIEDGNKAYDVFPDQTDVSLPESNGVNHIFLVHDPSVDNDITFHADTDDTGPSNPSLKIGTVDTSDNSSTTTNRAPDGDYGSLSADEILNGDARIATDTLTVSGTSDIVSDMANGRVIVELQSTESAFGGVDKVDFKSNGSATVDQTDTRGSNSRSYAIDGSGNLELTTSEECNLTLYKFGPQ